MSTPNAARNYFEDLAVPETLELGTHTFTAEEMRAFAGRYDPQPFHLDEAAARASLFGALTASGWHTAAIFIARMTAHRQRIEDAMRARGERPAAWGPSPGFKGLKWLRPVYVGDTIAFRSRRSGKIDLKSRPDRGMVLADNEGVNQGGERVFAISTAILVERRSPYVPDPPAQR